ncbi:mannitol dehydrogenase family protein [Phycicoccus sp. BSK3Z-2]|uniref:Mannitol-1-phosphate 5-dehydrogenase n=1 Tax=Phycicoccus avicenniae TaxID=2828860 RepID=A0A941I080_9MICO|nr:mannitol dehydrogenase family protein [Phycicoccus avicenniae]MBR7744923.1 mannitol dehydrogenase family protein [Phycicoccus avicenniae]
MSVQVSEDLSGTSVSHPGYDRTAASVGIVHFGVGNFHRSHQAMYLDRLMEAGSGLDWGICGVGVLPQDAAMRDVMRAQDGLYTLVVRHPDGSLEPRVVGSVLEYLFGPEDADAVYARLLDPQVRIVSLTVTEGGYIRNAGTGEFDASDPAVAHDVAHLDAPRTAFAFVVEGLRRRREAGLPPFTVLSCDNLQGNGDVCRSTVVGLAREVDADLADWIASEVSFPNCMVDRITPATTDDDRAVVADEFGIEDRWPVPAEPFTQWIVEDDFPLGRPELERVDVQFVDDVTPYELMKLRLLNATHQALAYTGAPLGYRLVHLAMEDDRVRRYLEAYMEQEGAPTLGELPGIDLPAYMRTLVERYGNPGIRDTLVRLATDGANRMATFTLPAVRDNLAAGRQIRLGAFMVAAWAEYWRLVASGDIAGDQVPPDVHADTMREAAAAEDPAAFVEVEAIFGSLGRDETFRTEYLGWRRVVAERGMHAALDAVLG